MRCHNCGADELGRQRIGHIDTGAVVTYNYRILYMLSEWADGTRSLTQLDGKSKGKVWKVYADRLVFVIEPA